MQWRLIKVDGKEYNWHTGNYYTEIKDVNGNRFALEKSWVLAKYESEEKWNDTLKKGYGGVTPIHIANFIREVVRRQSK